jgi:hypothetical protein
MKSFFLNMFGVAKDTLPQKEELSELDLEAVQFSYTRESIVKMCFEQNWDFIRSVEEAEQNGYDTFELSVRFSLKNVPVWYMQKLAAEAKAKICGAQDEKLLSQ